MLYSLCDLSYFSTYIFLLFLLHIKCIYIVISLSIFHFVYISVSKCLLNCQLALRLLFNLSICLFKSQVFTFVRFSYLTSFLSIFFSTSVFVRLSASFFVSASAFQCVSIFSFVSLPPTLTSFYSFLSFVIYSSLENVSLHAPFTLLLFVYSLYSALF